MEQGDDGYYYLLKIPSHCYNANVQDQIREINGIRWTDFDDEDHANELLDDPKLKCLYLSILPGGKEDDDSYSESSDGDGDLQASGSDISGDVSIATDDVDDSSRATGSVINKGPPSVTDRPKEKRNIFDNNSIDGDLDHVHEHDDEDDHSLSEEGRLYSTITRRQQAGGVNVSDASDQEDDADQEYYDYEQEENDGNDYVRSDSEEEAQSYKKNARKEADDRIAWRQQKEKEAQDAADKAKEEEKERAQAIKKRREEDQKREAAERRRKDELARNRKEAEAQGQKPQKATVKVERNIGQYDLSPRKSPNNKKTANASGSGGWSKIVSPKPTSPKPSAAGWNKVSANHKKNG